MNARERRSLREAVIGALVSVRTEHNAQQHEILEALFDGAGQMIDVDSNNFDGRTRRARNLIALRAQIADVKHEAIDYVLEFK